MAGRRTSQTVRVDGIQLNMKTSQSNAQVNTLGAQIINRRSSAGTFSKVKQQASRNINLIGTMILDQDDNAKSEAKKAQKVAEKNQNRKPQMPDVNEFKTRINEFRERVFDTAIPDQFNANILAKDYQQTPTA